MSKPSVLRPEAIADVDEIWTDMNANSPQAAARFLRRLRSTISNIEMWPEMYGLLWADVRAATVGKTRYLVLCIVEPAVVDSLAVMHGARDASAWQSRV